MRDNYQKKLKQLSDRVIDMGMLCEQAVMKTFQLLQSTENKKELIAEIEKYEKDIDEKEGEIEAITMQLLLRQQPMAADLRMISASMKLITDLERIGDQATDIAEIVETGSIRTPVNQPELLDMAKQALIMVGNCIRAYISRDAVLAQETIKSDDILDEMFAGMHKLLNNRDSGTNEQILDMMMIAKYYERIGDHATNVAEWVGFMMNGIHQNGDESFDIFNLGKDSKSIWLR